MNTQDEVATALLVASADPSLHGKFCTSVIDSRWGKLMADLIRARNLGGKQTTHRSGETFERSSSAVARRGKFETF